MPKYKVCFEVERYSREILANFSLCHNQRILVAFEGVKNEKIFLDFLYRVSQWTFPVEFSWISTACLNMSTWKRTKMIFRPFKLILELKHWHDSVSVMSIFTQYGCFNYAMKIDICSMLVNLIISRFHRLKVQDKKVILIKL